MNELYLYWLNEMKIGKKMLAHTTFIWWKDNAKLKPTHTTHTYNTKTE